MDTDGQNEGRPGPFRSVVTGGLHNCAEGRDGALTCWGNNGVEQVEIPPGL